MRPLSSYFRNKNVLLRVLVELYIITGVLLRLFTFFHNRCLIIDEANIVRNLAERNFMGLLHPLSYEQYAPPVFLWIEKASSLLFGYGEKAVRLYALLCGLGVLAVFPSLAKKLSLREGQWLPVVYVATGFIFIRYSAEVKQYMPDTLIALSLIWLALHWDIRSYSKKRFVLYWVAAGSLAIWSSMPSVFILAAIGCYYAWISLRENRYTNFGPLSVIAIIWLAQFAFYYAAILKAQINSDYLQQFHQEYFLIPFPRHKAELAHNWERLEDILGNVGGWSGVAMAANIIFLVVGGVHLFRKRKDHLILIGLPIILVLAAAAFRQFSLIDRVILFMMPLWALFIGFGFQVLWRGRWPIKSLLVLVSGFNVYAYADVGLFWHPFEDHQITRGMAWIQDRGARGTQVYVHHASIPSYIYYTQLHPHKSQWAAIRDAHLLNWELNYTDVTRNVRDTAYFLYTGGFAGIERDKRLQQIAQNMQQVGYYEYATCTVYVYVPKADQAAVTDAAGSTPN
jgi:hypothetical protein